MVTNTVAAPESYSASTVPDAEQPSAPFLISTLPPGWESDEVVTQGKYGMHTMNHKGFQILQEFEAYTEAYKVGLIGSFSKCSRG